MYLKTLYQSIRNEPKRFKWGVILLIINPPIGWIGALVFGALALKYKSSIWLIFATILYALTWLMAFAGLYLTGPRGKELVMSIFRRRKNDKFQSDNKGDKESTTTWHSDNDSWKSN